MRTSWKVGLATSAREPVPWATPRTKVVLPAPSSPTSNTTSPVPNLSPRSMPACSVSAGECVTSSGKVVVAGRLELQADDQHLGLDRASPDHLQAGLAHGVLRPNAHELCLFPARERLFDRGSRSTRYVGGLEDESDTRHRGELL